MKIWKTLAALCLALTMVVSLAACTDSDEPNNTSEPVSESGTGETTEPAEETTEPAEETTEPAEETTEPAEETTEPAEETLIYPFSFLIRKK